MSVHCVFMITTPRFHPLTPTFMDLTATTSRTNCIGGDRPVSLCDNGRCSAWFHWFINDLPGFIGSSMICLVSLVHQ